MFCCGATGLSSHAIARAFGHCFSGGDDYPRDPADLVRCRDYCASRGITTGQIRERMGVVSLEWAGLVAEWDDLLSMLAEEEPSGMARRTYARMRKILDEVQSHRVDA